MTDAIVIIIVIIMQERRYLVYDLMAINGAPVVDLPFSDRWNLIEREVRPPYIIIIILIILIVIIIVVVEAMD